MQQKVRHGKTVQNEPINMAGITVKEKIVLGVISWPYLVFSIAAGETTDISYRLNS